MTSVPSSLCTNLSFGISREQFLKYDLKSPFNLGENCFMFLASKVTNFSVKKL